MERWTEEAERAALADVVEPPARLLNAKAQAWLNAAVADGWECTPGPWRTGDDPDDRSVVLKRDELVVWLVDRETGMPDVPRTAWRHEEWLAGWARDGLHKITVPDVYDAAAMRDVVGECTECHELGAAARLKPISFAGRVCPTCDTPELRARMEPPGWYN